MHAMHQAIVYYNMEYKLKVGDKYITVPGPNSWEGFPCPRDLRHCLSHHIECSAIKIHKTGLHVVI